MSKVIIAHTFKEIQEEICTALELCDGEAKFLHDNWERPGGGGGQSRIMQKGKVFEKGGVNFSEVYGDLPANIAKEFKANSTAFYATGVSIVLHPNNPWVPIIHMNIRYFEMPEENIAWFGGGIDLTPHYVNASEAKSFHQALKTTCDNYHEDYYTKFKSWADNYFFIKHRKETRGIGGIFFDRLTDGNPLSMEQQFQFVSEVGRTFTKAYLPIVEANKNRAFTEREKQWQLLRRGRYVEFNLVYDRGTKFGLETDGRIESILMSLPQMASWQYDFQPEAGSLEEATLAYLRTETNWM